MIGHMDQTKANRDKGQPPISVRAPADVNRLRRFGASLGGLCCAICVLLPSLAKAQCRSWDVNGSWFVTGAGDFYNFQLTQKGYSISGLATKGTAQTKVTGNVMGGGFYLHLASGFELRGDIEDDGRIRGVVHDLNNPNKKLQFASSRPMKCADRIVTPPPAASPKRVISHKGKSRTDASAPAGVPNIVAFNKPGQAPGTLTVTWDAGPEHPYAEVWVSVDGGEETKVVEQGKGTRQISVESGKTYRYILTDSGQQLATTTVKAR